MNSVVMDCFPCLGLDALIVREWELMGVEDESSAPGAGGGGGLGIERVTVSNFQLCGQEISLSYPKEAECLDFGFELL